jgi:hypothetical protein
MPHYHGEVWDYRISIPSKAFSIFEFYSSMATVPKALLVNSSGLALSNINWNVDFQATYSPIRIPLSNFA